MKSVDHEKTLAQAKHVVAMRGPSHELAQAYIDLHERQDAMKDMREAAGFSSWAEVLVEVDKLRGDHFQAKVYRWMRETFSEEICKDITERNHRFLEEALELVQATGCGADEAHKLVDYVYGRPVGETQQEIGGVMVTLAALCGALGIKMQKCGDHEIERVMDPEIMQRIREKQKTKPKFSPLPGVYPERVDIPTVIPQHARELRKCIAAMRVGTDPDGSQFGQQISPALEDIDLILKSIATQPDALCNRPPAGWACSRSRFHSGPCAASQVTE